MLTNKCCEDLNTHTYLEYDDSDIHTYIEAYIGCNLEGKKIYCSYLLKGIGKEGTFPLTSKGSDQCFVMVTPAVSIGMPIDYFFCKTKQPETQEEARDVFDEFCLLNQNSIIKILFPYSYKQSHWLTAEIVILANNKSSDIQVYMIAHDPDGEKKFTQEEVDPLQQTILKKLKEIYGKRNINFFIEKSPYSRPRQRNLVSSGAIVAEELTLLIAGGDLVGNHLGEPWYDSEIRQKHLGNLFKSKETCSSYKRFYDKHKLQPTLGLENKPLEASEVASKFLIPTLKSKHGTENMKNKLIETLKQDLSTIETVEKLIEKALELDRGMYDHLPENWRNPGMAGLCVLRLLKDVASFCEEQYSDEMKDFLKKIDSASEEALNLIQQNKDPIFVKRLINTLYESKGGFIASYYDNEKFSEIQLAIQDLPKEGQLVYRGSDGVFFVLVDNRYITEVCSIEEATPPKHLIGCAHITINEGMTQEDSYKLWEKLYEQFGETKHPIYEASKKVEVKYINKKVKFEVIGGYDGSPKTHSRQFLTKQLEVKIEELEELICPYTVKAGNYRYHITFGEIVRQSYYGLTYIKEITEVLTGSLLSKQLCEILKGDALKPAIEKNEYTARSKLKKPTEENNSCTNSFAPAFLPEKGVNYIKLPKDGNGLYNAVALHLEEKDAFCLRQIVAANLKHNIEVFKQFIVLPKTKTIEDYIEDLENTNEWVGGLDFTKNKVIELHILSKVINKIILLIGPDGDIINKEALDNNINVLLQNDIIFVCYDVVNHYGGIILQEGYEAKDILALLNQSANEAVVFIGKTKLYKFKTSTQQELPKNLVNKTVAAFLKYNLLPKGVDCILLPKDGHCLYNAVALHFEGQDAYSLRTRVAEYLEHHIDKFKEWIPLQEGKTINDYIMSIRNTTEWGGDVELRILSEMLDTTIVVLAPNGKIINKYEDSHINEPLQNAKSLFVYYNGINHYDGIILQENYEFKDILASLTQNINDSGAMDYEIQLISQQKLLKKDLFEKTSYQAKFELGQIIETLKGSSSCNLNNLSEYVQQIDLLLRNQLPNGLRTISLSGFLAMEIVFSVTNLGENWSIQTKTFFANSIHTLRKKITMCLPLKWKQINLEYWLYELFNQDSEFNRTEHEINLAKVQQDSVCELDEILKFTSLVLPEDIKKLLEHCEEIDKLLIKFKDANSEKNYENIVDCLLDLGNFWQKDGAINVQSEQILWGGAFTYSLMFYNAALNVCKIKQIPKSEKIKDYIIIVEGLLLTACNAENKNTRRYSTTEQNRENLKNIRDGLYDKFECFLKSHHIESHEHLDNHTLLNRAHDLQEIMQDLSNDLKIFIGKLISQAEILLGSPPCKYAVIGLGSIAKQSCTPFSDIEYAILLQEQAENQTNKENILKYFKNLNYIFQSKIINLGETAIPFDLFNISFDHLTVSGFCLDLGGKTPLGRHYDSKDSGDNYGELKYELIATPELLSQYLDDKYFKVDKLLPHILQRCTHIYGDDSLTSKYKNLVDSRFKKTEHGQSLYAKRALEALQGNDYLKYGDLKFFPQIINEENSGKPYNVKQEIYRISDRLIEDLAFFYEIIEENVEKNIEKLIQKGVINKECGNSLCIMNGISNEIRLQTYKYYKGQKERMNILKYSIDTENEFHIKNSRALLFRFYYSAIPFCENLKKWIKDLDLSYLNEEDFFNNDLFLQSKICLRLYDFNEAKKKIEQHIEQCIKNSVAIDEEVFQILGFTNLRLGNYDEAIGALKVISNMQQETYRDPNWNQVKAYVSTLSQLGKAFEGNGNYEKALEYQQQALKIEQEFYGDRDPDLALTLNNIGTCYCGMNKFHEALKYFQKSLEIRQKFYGTEHFYIANNLSNIGLVFKRSGEYQDALEYFQRAFKITQKIYGNDHPYVARICNNIGTIYDKIGKYNQAQEYYERSLEIYQKTYSTEHPSLAISIVNVGGSYFGSGKYQKALEYYQEALRMMQKIYPNGHEQIAKIYYNMGILYRKHHSGDKNQELECLQQSLEVFQKTYYDNEPIYVAEINNQLGHLYYGRNEYKKALEHFFRSLKIWQKFYSDEHPDVVKNFNDIGNAYNGIGDHKKALEYFQKALKIYDKYNQNAEIVTASLNGIGETYNRIGNHKKAIESLQLALSVQEQIVDDKCPDSDKALFKISLFNNIGGAYFGMHQYNQASEYFQNALKICGDNHPDSKDMLLNNIHGVYLAMHTALEYLRNKYGCNDKESILRKIAEVGSLEDLNLLLNMGVDINKVDHKTGKTAIHYASQKGNMEIVKTLIMSGAKIDIVDQGGFSPLGLALQSNHNEVVGLFTAMNNLISIASQPTILAQFFSSSFNKEDKFERQDSRTTFTPLRPRAGYV